MKRNGCLAAGMVLWGVASSCWAWGSLIMMDSRPQQDVVSIGGQVMSLPRAPGSASSSQALIPGFDYYGRSGIFVSTENGVGWNASTNVHWVAGLRMWPQFGRSKSEASHAPAVGDRLQMQEFANWMPNEVLMLQSAVSEGSGLGRHGVQSEWGLTSGIPLGSDLLGVGVSATWANRDYQHSYLGRTGSGWADWSWTASTTHRFNARWHLDAQWQWAHLIGPAPGLQSRQEGGLIALWYDY
ncbi:MAG TPA: MipA/OmpV family protein [Aquabacterium sp.]|nr:MipA/OmpV family protein [Aquabacterium sp.]